MRLLDTGYRRCGRLLGRIRVRSERGGVATTSAASAPVDAMGGRAASAGSAAIGCSGASGVVAAGTAVPGFSSRAGRGGNSSSASLWLGDSGDNGSGEALGAATDGLSAGAVAGNVFRALRSSAAELLRSPGSGGRSSAEPATAVGTSAGVAGVAGAVAGADGERPLASLRSAGKGGRSSAATGPAVVASGGVVVIDDASGRELLAATGVLRSAGASGEFSAGTKAADLEGDCTADTGDAFTGGC